VVVCIGKLRRSDEWGKKRRRGQVGDRESVGCEVARGTQLASRPLHGRQGLAAGDLGNGRVDLHSAPLKRDDERRNGTMGQSGGQSRMRHKCGLHKVGVGKDEVKDPSPDIGPELLIEVVLQLESAAPFRWLGRIKGWLWVGAFERLDDLARVADYFAVQLEHREGALRRSFFL